MADNIVPRGRRFFITALIFLACLTIPAHHGFAKVTVIRVQFRDAGELLPMVRDMLSPKGKASADSRTNSLVIVDDEASIEQIRNFVSQFDAPAEQVKVRLRFVEKNSMGKSSLSAQGRVSGNGWSVSKGGTRSDGVEIRVQDRSRQRDRESEFFIGTLSGSWAYILVGKDILFRERWVDFCRRYARIREQTTIQRIETGMDVRPVVSGGRAHVEILPRISHSVPGTNDRIIRFSGASTRLTVPLGRWVEIGGTHQKRNEVIQAVLASGREEGSAALAMFMMVEPMN